MSCVVFFKLKLNNSAVQTGGHDGVTAISLMQYDANQFHLPSRVWGFAEARTEDGGNLRISARLKGSLSFPPPSELTLL